MWTCTLRGTLLAVGRFSLVSVNCTTTCYFASPLCPEGCPRMDAQLQLVGAWAADGSGKVWVSSVDFGLVSLAPQDHMLNACWTAGGSESGGCTGARSFFASRRRRRLLKWENLKKSDSRTGVPWSPSAGSVGFSRLLWPPIIISATKCHLLYRTCGVNLNI